MVEANEAVGRCGDPAPSLRRLCTAPVHCALPAGHAGWHKGDDDSEWTYGEVGMRTAMEALADRWETEARGYVDPSDGPIAFASSLERCARQLRVALDGAAASDGAS